MSERELADIGLSTASLPWAVARAAAWRGAARAWRAACMRRRPALQQLRALQELQRSSEREPAGIGRGAVELHPG